MKLRIRSCQAGTDRLLQVNADDVLIGRAAHADLRLCGAGIAWEHARLVQREGNVELHCLASEGCDVNGVVPSGPMRIRSGDVVRLGTTTELTIVEDARIKAWHIMYPAVVLVGIVLLIAWFKEKPTPAPSLDRARLHAVYEPWIDDMTRKGALPHTVLLAYRSARRCELAGDRLAATQAWSRLEILLCSLAPPQPTEGDALLYRVCNDGVSLNNDKCAQAGLLQLARRSLRWNQAQLKEKS